MKNSKPSIDQVLLRLNESHSWTEEGDYDDFLQKLKAFDKQNVTLDEVLTEKLQTSEAFEKSSYKRIIFLVWYRRFRNALALVLLFFVAVYVYDQYLVVQAPVEELSHASIVAETPANSDVLVTEGKQDSSSNSKLSNQTLTHAEKTSTPLLSFNQNSKQTESISNQMNDINSNAGLSEDRLSQSTEEELSHSRYSQLCRLQYPFFSGQFDLSPADLVYNQNNDRSANELIIPQPSMRSGLILGFNLMGSFQSYKTEMNPDQEKNTNRNYQALANDGKRRVFRMNYGFSVEKKLIRNFTLSSGAELFTIIQKQKTDYELNEAPVYDIDGSIAGYIHIAPERIRQTSSSRIAFMTLPLIVKYSFEFGAKNSIQMRLGTAMMYELNKSTSKFDYQSLQHGEYAGKDQKISFNNIRCGFEYNRNIGSGFMLGIGLERMVIPKLHQMSDATETRKTNAINLNVSIKYQLEK